MRKLALLLCIVIMLVATTASASACDPKPGTFTITGYTTGYDYRTGPNGRTWFHLTAAGESTGYFTGPFTFEEWGVVDFDPETGQGSGRGTNTGVVTISTDDGQEVVRFAGVTDSVSVWGKFTVDGNGSCGCTGPQGWGSYTGNAGFVFSVTFTGKFLD